MWFLLPRLTKVFYAEGENSNAAHTVKYPREGRSASVNISECDLWNTSCIPNKNEWPSTREQLLEKIYQTAEMFCRCLIGFAAFWGSAVAFAARLGTRVGRAPHGKDIKRARPRLAYRRAPGQIPCGHAWSLGPSSAFWHGSWDQILKKYRIELSYICQKTNEFGGGLSVHKYVHKSFKIYTLLRYGRPTFKSCHCVILRFFINGFILSFFSCAFITSSLAFLLLYTLWIFLLHLHL